MAFALGLGDQLVGITHECDYPPEVEGKPVVVRNVLPIERMSQAEIDIAVTQRMRDGLSLYQVDEKLLRDLAPDMIIMQDLCQVCAPSGNEVTQTLKLLPKKPQILWLTPKSLDEIFDNLRELGQATDRRREAQELIATGRSWSHLPAVRSGRVYAVDANSYFARPGPRVVEGTELLAHLIHPDLFKWEGSPEAFRKIEFSRAASTTSWSIV